MGRSDPRELRSRLVVLIAHLLKWQAQPQSRSNSWLATVAEQRRRLARLLLQNPRLRPLLDQALGDIYNRACATAAKQTGIPAADFPTDCPFTLDEVLSLSFLPD